MEIVAELAVGSRVVDFKKEEDVFLEGQNPLGMFVVVDGAVKVYKFNPEGREQVLTVEKPIGMVAELPLLDALPYPASAIALEDSRLLLVPKEHFEQVLKRHPQLALTIIRNISQRLRHLVMLIEEISFLEVPQRLARYLLSEADARVEFEIAHTNTEIASRIGTVRELVSRNLSRFAKEGIIELDGKKVRIVKREKLESLAGHV